MNFRNTLLATTASVSITIMATGSSIAEDGAKAFAFEPDTLAYITAEAARPPTAGLGIDQIREGYVASVTRTSVAPDMSVASADIMITGGMAPIKGRIYTPDGVDGAVTGLLLYVHGGGFAAGDLESHDRLLRLIAAALGHKVMAIDYRRAPESPFPAALDDARAAFRYAIDNAIELKIDPARVAIGGESAGATHAVATALSLKNEAGARPIALWAFVPALDGTGSGSSYKEFASGAGRTAEEFLFLWSLYAPKDANRQDPGLSPAFADPQGLPATFLYAAEFDPVRSDSENFTAKAKSAGVDIKLTINEGLIHQFPEITGVSAASRVAVLAAVSDLKAVLDGQ